MRNDILERKAEILDWVAEGLSLTEMKNRLHCKHNTLKQYLTKLDINYAGQQNRVGQQKGPNKYKPSSYYTYKGAPTIPSAVLREKLIKDGVKKAACEGCGITHWQGKLIHLELHHIDGDHFNNELANLQILCPNCHAIITMSATDAQAVYREQAKQLQKEQKIIEAKNRADARINLQESERAAKLASGRKIDTIGRFNASSLSDDLWEARKDMILTSGVDLTKFGWKTELQQVTGLTRRQVDLTISHFWEDFCDKIYIRN